MKWKPWTAEAEAINTNAYHVVTWTKADGTKWYRKVKRINGKTPPRDRIDIVITASLLNSNGTADIE
jgi:hypothetical protein